MLFKSVLNCSMNKKPTFDQAITLYEMGVKSSPVPMQCQFPGAYVRTISQGVGLSLWWYLYTYKKCASLTVQPQLYTFMLLTFCSSYLYNFTGVCHILATYIVRVIQLFLCACHTCNSHDSVRINLQAKVSATVRLFGGDSSHTPFFDWQSFQENILYPLAIIHMEHINVLDFDDKSERNLCFSFGNLGIIFNGASVQLFPPREKWLFGWIRGHPPANGGRD